MNETEMQQMLLTAQAIFNQPEREGADQIKLWQLAMQLAQAEYPPAKDLVAACLEEMQQALAQAQVARDNPEPGHKELDKVRWQMHDLAEAQYQPAIEFFASCFDHEYSEWRLASVRDVGFHYPLTPDSPVTEKIRQLLLNDPDDGVRHAAAFVLSSRSRWPDSALSTALYCDPDDYVRNAAFQALLELAGVPYLVACREYRRAKSGEIQPTWDEIKRIVIEAGIDPATLGF